VIPVRSSLAVLLVAFSTAAPARAEDSSALYQAYWAGVPAAEMRLTVHDGPEGYREELAVRAEGLARLATHFRAIAVSSGQLAGGVVPAPSRFDAHYDLRKRRKQVLAIVFVAADGGTLAERAAGDTSRKPPLPAGFRRNVMDPLSVFAAIREAVRRHAAAFTIPAYDGARRFDVLGRASSGELDGKRVWDVALTLRPIAGFKGDTSDDDDPDSAPRPVALTLADDAALMPVAMTVRVYYLPLTVELERLCTAAQPCPW
jgi:hypothetical protein